MAKQRKERGIETQLSCIGLPSLLSHLLKKSPQLSFYENQMMLFLNPLHRDGHN